MSLQNKEQQPENDYNNVNKLAPITIINTSTYITLTEKNKLKSENIIIKNDEVFSQEILNIKKILGLQEDKIYTKKDMDSLPYGSIRMME